MSPQSPGDQVYVGAYGYCRDGGDRLLLARLFQGPDAGRWTLPGGGVLWGEHPDQAVIREMEEETGLVDLEIGPIIAIYSHTYSPTKENPLPPLHHIGLVYQLAPASFQLQNERDGSTDLCQWLTESEARSLSLTPLGEFGVKLAWGKNVFSK